MAPEAKAIKRPSAEIDAGELRELGDRLAGAAGLTDKANAFDDRDALREFAAAAAQGARVAEVRDRPLASARAGMSCRRPRAA